MESGAVTEGFDVIEDGGAGLGTSGEAVVIDQFVFEGAPEGFNQGVIIALPGRLVEATWPCSVRIGPMSGGGRSFPI